MKPLAPALLLVLAACGGEAPEAKAQKEAPAQAGAEPAFFLGGYQNPELLAAIRKAARPKIDFAGHFSLVEVPCGTGCSSAWFVDRRNGAIAAAPNEADLGQSVWDIAADPASDEITVTYGPMDRSKGACEAQGFHWSGETFIEIAPRQAAPCPK